MAEDQTTSEATQREAADQSLRDTTQTTQREAGGETQQQSDAGRTVSYASHMKLLDEKKKLQDKLQKYEEAETASLSETERATKERDRAKQELAQLRDEIRLSRIEAAAAKAGAVYPDAVASLIPADAVDAREIERAIANLRKDRPRLFNTQTVDGGAGNGSENGTSPQDMNALIRNAMRR